MLGIFAMKSCRWVLVGATILIICAPLVSHAAFAKEDFLWLKEKQNHYSQEEMALAEEFYSKFFRFVIETEGWDDNIDFAKIWSYRKTPPAIHPQKIYDVTRTPLFIKNVFLKNDRVKLMKTLGAKSVFKNIFNNSLYDFYVGDEADYWISFSYPEKVAYKKIEQRSQSIGVIDDDKVAQLQRQYDGLLDDYNVFMESIFTPFFRDYIFSVEGYAASEIVSYYSRHGFDEVGVEMCDYALDIDHQIYALGVCVAGMLQGNLEAALIMARVIYSGSGFTASKLKAEKVIDAVSLIVPLLEQDKSGEAHYLLALIIKKNIHLDAYQGLSLSLKDSHCLLKKSSGLGYKQADFHLLTLSKSESQIDCSKFSLTEGASD